MQEMVSSILESSFELASTQRVLATRFYTLKPSMLLYGPPKSGKNSLALCFGRAFKKIVYVDFQDARLIDSMRAHIHTFCDTNPLGLLILNRPPADFTPPSVPTIIIDSTPIHAPAHFICQPIMPLNFAEFVHFCKKDPPALLARFLKEGNLPAMLFLPAHAKIRYKQDICALSFGAHFDLFKALLFFQAKSISTHHLYTQLKKHIRTSKDTLYFFLATLQKSLTLFLVPSYFKAPPKIYFYDFALPYAFSHTHSLVPVFENMVALELIRHFGSKSLHYHGTCLIVQSSSPFACFPYAFPTPESLEHHLSLLLKVLPPMPILVISINYTHVGRIASGQTYQTYSFSHFCLNILPTL
ncbi:ATP-binding protein [Helicobacter mehlei]|uniref:ATP-binding protein n=1 Tax=Helicobacter mehlei TaxID=2316080 RepID=A0A553UUU0_9HELI|nr:ATP-binding protein [Helicobacter mehlei]TSA83953.1 ATP-binding protein [Helicobacter mehlei]